MFELLENVNTLGTNTDVLTPEEDAFMENYSTGWECNYDDACDALIFTMLENEQNFNAIMQATMVQEANYFIENGVEMVYEAVDFKAFFGKIKEAVMKAWEKIKVIFNKVLSTMQGWVKMDESFIKKNEADLEAAIALGVEVEFEGYDVFDKSFTLFENLMYASKYISVADFIKKVTTTEDIISDVTRTASSQKAETREDYIKYTKEALGIDKKVKLRMKMDQNIVNEIKGAKSSRDEAKKQYDKTKKLFKELASTCDKQSKEAAAAESKDEAKKVNKAAGEFSRAMSYCIGLANVAFNSTISAINIKHSQSKIIAKKALAEQKKQDKDTENRTESTSESAHFSMDSVELI